MRENEICKVRPSKRKLNPEIRIGFVQKSGKFVVQGKNLIVYEKGLHGV